MLFFILHPLGHQRYQRGSLGTLKGFTGQYNDNLTGLDYYGSRYYDQKVGVFLSADSVQGNLLGMNPYGYVNGNPETFADPTDRYLVGASGVDGGSSAVYTVPPVSFGGGGGPLPSGSGSISPSLMPDYCTLIGCHLGANAKGPSVTVPMTKTSNLGSSGGGCGSASLGIVAVATCLPSKEGIYEFANSSLQKGWGTSMVPIRLFMMNW